MVLLICIFHRDLGNLFGEDDEEGIDRHFSTEDKEAIFEMKQTPNLYQRLVDRSV